MGIKSSSFMLAVVLGACGGAGPVAAAPSPRSESTPAVRLAAPAPRAAAADARMRVHFINVGQGAATLFEFPGAAILVDTGGENTGGFDGTAALDAYLSTFFGRHPELDHRLTSLVLTHPHIDHTRGVADVLANYHPKNVVTNGQTEGSGGPQQNLAQNYAADHDGGNDPVGFVAVREEQVPKTGLTNAVIDPVGGSPIDPTLTVLWGRVATDPGWGNSWGKPRFENANNHSVVLRVDFGQASVLITGDLEAQAIGSLLQKYAGTSLLDVDVWEVGHHGSFNGTTQALVTALSPEYAVIEMGSSDREDPWTAWAYGHPREEVIQLLQAGVSKTRPSITVPVGQGAKEFDQATITKAIYGTGWDGTVVLEAGADGVFRVVAPGGGAGGGDRLVDINTATADQLATLPRIGPAKAAAIVAYRSAHGPFTTVDDLDKVSGIGPATVEAVRALVSVGPP